MKKDGVNLRLVHILEPLNKVTIAHSGVPPATEILAAQFAGRVCGGMFHLYVGYSAFKVRSSLGPIAFFWKDHEPVRSQKASDQSRKKTTKKRSKLVVTGLGMNTIKCMLYWQK